MRLIDADELKQADFQDFSNTDVMYAIDHMPTVDPIQHWKWIAQNGYCECSECHYYSNMYTKHCPNCGAKMNDNAGVGNLSVLEKYGIKVKKPKRS